MQRLTISIDDDLAADFDALIEARRYSNRSEAFRDLVRRELQQERLARQPDAPCVGTLTYLYDHHDRTTAMRLMDMQHDCHHSILSTQHLHLDHDNCLETIVVRGKPSEIYSLADQLTAIKGIKHGNLAISGF